MPIIESLAVSLNRRDELPNVKLAKEIVRHNDQSEVAELVKLLNHQSKAVQHNSIKVIYEIGALNPTLLSKFFTQVFSLLETNDNRLQWGAMSTLNTMTSLMPAKIYQVLPKLIEVADKGSVITHDHCVAILIKLYCVDQFASNVMPLMIERLQNCATNQLPMYAENVMPFIRSNDEHAFVNSLTSRLFEIERESKRKRVEKVILKIQKRK